MNAIWKDYFYMLTDSPENFPDGIRYRVRLSNETIFEGRAYLRPTDSEIIIRLNDIIEPYLRANLPLEETDVEKVYIFVDTYQNGAWVTPAVGIWFTRDWSYDRTVTPGDDNPCRHIINRVHPLQYLPCWADDGVYDIGLNYQDATGDYNSDYSSDYLVTGSRTEEVEVTNSGNFHFLNMATYLGAASVTVYDETIPVGGCERFILYYVNAYGGWDWLPVEGKTKEADTITRHTYDVAYNNYYSYSRGRFNHVNELAHKYTFYTGWLTDSQSKLMHHLLNSVMVYVHDTETGEVLPVVLSNPTTERKQNGLNQYTIEAELAQTRLRR